MHPFDVGGTISTAKRHDVQRGIAMCYAASMTLLLTYESEQRERGCAERVYCYFSKVN